MIAPVAVLAAFLLAGPASAASPKTGITLPDLTKGGTIPETANHHWTLGATGARGWIYSDKLTTTDARQIAIVEIAKGSPADGILEKGDVILGVGGEIFSYDPRTELGKALTHAESDAGAGDLAVTRWREGKSEEITLKLPVLGDYSATAPYDCPKSKRILELGCAALAKRMKEADKRQNPISRSLNALALLASGNPEYLPLVKREARWAADYSADSMMTWYYGYVITLLAEYTMATGDASVMKGLRRLALEAANGQSIVGSWGHKFAGPDGRLVGYGMMNAPGTSLTTSLVLARAAGVKDPAVDLAIERSAKLLRFYAGKGSIPYGDHVPWMESHDDNGKNGMAAVLFNLLDEPQPAEYFSRMSLASHGAERDCGHTGNFWNMTWAMPGVAPSGPEATGAWMQEFGTWYFDLARAWDGSYRHQGPPQIRNDSTAGWDSTGAYLIAHAMPLKKIFLTGKREGKVPQLAAEEAQQIVRDGRGWSNKDRHGAYDQLSVELLFDSLSSWSPVVRQRAAIALARRGEVPVPALVKLLESGDLHTRLGACAALAQLKGKAEPAVPALRATLQDKHYWLRIKAADALAAIGEPAMVALPELLEMIAKGPTAEDPRGMEQRFLCFAVFGQMLRNSLDGVDRKLLYKAVAAALKNDDGRARGVIGSVYRNLSAEEIKPLLPIIHQAVAEPAPSGIMFADGIRMEGLRLMATHRLEEGIKASVDYARLQNPWGSEKRIAAILEILSSYGAHAQPVIPDLKRLADELSKGEEGFPMKLSLQKADDIRETIRLIEASEERPALTRIR